MNCALRTTICAFVSGLFILSNTSAVLAKSEKDHATATDNSSSASEAPVPVQFKWSEHNKLSWRDFRGPVNARSEESAAATHCGIGFRTTRGVDGNIKVVVYNTFYSNLSWVRPDAQVPSILDHEQGHFDLCEVYTRKLRDRMNNFNFNVADVNAALISIYDEVNDEYQRRQQAYELETTHGTNIAVQQRWTYNISRELSVAAAYVSVN